MNGFIWLDPFNSALHFTNMGFPISGDEIFSVNGLSVAGLTHSEAIWRFKETKVGSLQVTLGRREARKGGDTEPTEDG